MYTNYSDDAADTRILVSCPSGPSCSNMTLNTQREKEPLRRRGSTPIQPTRLSQQPSWTRGPQPDPEQPRAQRSHPPLGQSASYHPGDKSLHYRAQWSSDSDDDSQSDSDCVYRVVLLGDHGVGKSSLAGIFAGITDKDEQPGGGMFRWVVDVPTTPNLRTGDFFFFSSF